MHTVDGDEGADGGGTELRKMAKEKSKSTEENNNSDRRTFVACN